VLPLRPVCEKRVVLARMICGTSVGFVNAAVGENSSRKLDSLLALSVQIKSSLLLETDTANKLLGATGGTACVWHGYNVEASTHAPNMY